MKPHDIFIDVYDTPGRLLALDFGEVDPASREYVRPPRVVVQWGDSVTAWAVGFELRRVRCGGRTFDEWHRFDVPQTWTGSVVRAAREGGRSLGPCRDFESMAARPRGPGLGPLSAWLRGEARRLRDEHEAKAAQRKALIAEAGDGKWSTALQDQLAALECDAQRPVTIEALSGSWGLLAVFGAWLGNAGRRLVHGAEVEGLYSHFRIGYSGPSEVDQLAYVALALDLLRRYDYDPQPGQYRHWSHGALTPAQQLAWRQHGRLPGSIQGSVTPHGSHFWYFAAGSRLRQLPEYSM